MTPLPLEAIFRYIAEHPGCDVRDIERHTRSSGTTWLTLHELERARRVRSEKDEKQQWRFYAAEEET